MPKPIMSIRMEVVNRSWRRMAKKYNLPIVDAGGASLARRDVNFDNSHYLLTDPDTHKRIKGRIGNEVTLAFAQMVLNAFLEAFAT